MEEASTEVEIDQENCPDPDVVEIVASIEKRLLASASGEEVCTIFRVPNALRQVNEKWYEPQVISIGPYHHGKERLKLQEGRKLKHLQSILGRNPSVRLEDYVKKMKESEERAWQCYSESISMNRHEFVEMLLLDGCFLVETFLRCGTKWRPPGLIPGLCSGHWFPHFMAYDSLLLENQLPFFILERIFDTVTCTRPIGLVNSMAALVAECFDRNMTFRFNAHASTKKHHHLLDLLHHHCLPTKRPNQSSGDGACSSEISVWVSAKDYFPSCFSCVQPASDSAELQAPSTIPSAEELQAAGVKFKRQDSSSFIDIEFQKNIGVIKIPYVDFTEDVIYTLKNLIALEQCRIPVDDTFFTAYSHFMDNIINTPKDVQILRQSGILEHGMGSDQEFALLFNTMHRGAMLGKGHLRHLHKEVNDYCGTKWHIWRANLMQKYFNTPWAVVSFAGAILLLLLTAIQTLFAVK